MADEKRVVKKKRKKAVAKVNIGTVDCEFIHDLNENCKKGTKAKFSAPTAADFYVKGYVKLTAPAEAKKVIPETIKFVEDHKKEVDSLRDELGTL